MNIEEAFANLESTSQHVRLSGARFLAEASGALELERLRRFKRAEVDAYVVSALDSAVARAVTATRRASGQITDGSYDGASEIKRETYGMAVRWVAGTLLHELAALIGLADLSASSEVENYKDSRTFARMHSLKKMFSAIEHLQKASQGSRPERFDLPSFIDSIIADEPNHADVDISFVGPRPLSVLVDPSLFRLAFCNGFRNAIDAVGGESFPNGEHPIIVSWGETDENVWVSVLDLGRGISSLGDLAFNIGTTNKKGHHGLGLAIAKQAMDTVGGIATLSPSSGSGACFRLEWSRS